MVRDGLYYGGGLLLAAILVGTLFHPGWATPFVVLSAFCFWFFRDPERQIPSGPVAVSPADGKITHVKAMDDGGIRVSVFLNIFNVHVNRTPVAGRVTSIEYQAGRFKMAHLEEASDLNEQNTLVVEPSELKSGPIEFKQIAGLIARRIICYSGVGDVLDRGERFGHIQFGSRMDVRFGPEWELTVARGDKVAAGSSVIARLKETA